MREVRAEELAGAVARLCQEANVELSDDVVRALQAGVQAEQSPVGREILRQIIENATIARDERLPMCQDTGVAVVFVELGQDVRVTGGDYTEAINAGVRRGYQEGYLRKSMCHPFTRRNTGDNTPAVIHTQIVPGDRVRITVAPKGGGSENMSGVKLLTPAAGLAGVRDFAVGLVEQGGPNPCPPVIVGVGIGGTMEVAALLAKRALLRPIGSHHADPDMAQLERDILSAVNDLGVGPQGLGGRVTALWAAVEWSPCHIASLPVAVNINCHAARHAEMVI
ncbi:MAG: fumarate hydratase [Bacillota bacterium]